MRDPNCAENGGTGRRPLPGFGPTTSICPDCGTALGAEVIERRGRVLISRECPDHGLFEAVVYGDAKRYAEIQRYNKPGEEPLERQTEVDAAARMTAGSAPSTPSTPASGSSR